TFPTTNTCPNTLPYLYDGHSWTEYASNFVIIFKYVSEKNFDTRPIPSLIMDIVIVNDQSTIDPLCGNVRMSRFPSVILAGRRNRPCIEIILQNVFEDNDEIRCIFSPRVTVIEIRKRVRACIRRRE
ncbi:hypothetical protein SFRURICE_000350, partial [Spodoptera frugiperda]